MKEYHRDPGPVQLFIQVQVGIGQGGLAPLHDQSAQRLAQKLLQADKYFLDISAGNATIFLEFVFFIIYLRGKGVVPWPSNIFAWRLSC
mgnify:CR=1 FL=1